LRIFVTESILNWAQIPIRVSVRLSQVSWRVALLIGVCAVLFFHALGRRDLWGSHEARAAQNAQRMLDDGAWGLPRLFDDHNDLQKPPMYYWLVAGLTRLTGGRVDAWTGRLPAALSRVLFGFAVSHFFRP